MIRRSLTPCLTIACLLLLVLAFYGRALFQGEQFAYRDAAHYYYPLYQRVQNEWKAGRLPLWEPEENSGMPLLGNPTAAVLYPGKLIFTVVPYPLGMRLYVVGHTLLAFAAMMILLRGWEISWTGSAVGALAYAFGGPIIFQYCNVIYLVGAAWLPLGFRAVDRWIRLGRRLAMAELAVVLTMETLGGDPESAYLTGICAGGYALALAWSRRSIHRFSKEARRPPRAIVKGLFFSTMSGLLAAWVFGTLIMARWAPSLRPPAPPKQPSLPLPWMMASRVAVMIAWIVLGLILLARGRRLKHAGNQSILVPMLAGLAWAAFLAGCLAGAQLFPVLEFTGQSGRAAGDGPHDIFPFSLHPLRIVEFLWPNIFGTPFHGNKFWVGALPPVDTHPKVWAPTLYLGALTLVLALGSLQIRSVAPWQVWMIFIAALSLLGSLGEYGGPLWTARLAPKMAKMIGDHDPRETPTIREDGYLRDGDGSVYWFLANGLPGFRQFRFPSKLLTLTAFALTALAGQGWDALQSGTSNTRRRVAAWSVALLALSLLVLSLTIVFRSAFFQRLNLARLSSDYGPFDAAGAVVETQRALVQAAVVLVAALGLIWFTRRHARIAAILVLIVTSADLAVANAPYVMTVPQSLLDDQPEVWAQIERAERDKPADGPYRVHRVPLWSPPARSQEPSNDLARDLVAWERSTIQPKYGITLGVHYTRTLGVAELYDYDWYFGGFRRGATASAARFLGIPRETPVVVYPRRAFDMWNTRYFILPYYPSWDDEHRGIASFLDATERIEPPADAFLGPAGLEKERSWVLHRDYQILRNLNAFPRAWVVHESRGLKPLQGLSRVDRKLPMEEIVFSNDRFWEDQTRTVYDPRRLVWVERDDQLALSGSLPGGRPELSETVRVVSLESERVVLEAQLQRPGVVVLADIFYPGWELSIDGVTAPIYRVNRMMRGAAVPSGRHTLVYTYRPLSVRLGLIISGIGLIALSIFMLWSIRSPGVPSMVKQAEND